MEELREFGRLAGRSYDLAASRYDELFGDELDRKPWDRRLLDAFAAHFTRDALIHDLGCGPAGHIGHYLHAKGLRVIGSDISPQCVDLASARHPEMEFRVMDMADLPVEDQSIDGIVSYYSIIHTPRRLVPGLFREFHRVLKARGKLLLAVKEGEQEGFVEDLLGIATRLFFTHFTKEEIAGFLAGNGFRSLFLEERSPLEGEIAVPRIFAIGEKE